MKSKEMAEEYKANPTQETLIGLLRKLITETSKIASARHVRTNSGMASILREQDDKWRSFTRKAGGDWFNAYKVGIHNLIPESKILFP